MRDYEKLYTEMLNDRESWRKMYRELTSERDALRRELAEAKAGRAPIRHHVWCECECDTEQDAIVAARKGE